MALDDKFLWARRLGLALTLHLVRGEHPSVFRAAALGGIDHQRTFAQRHPRQAARHDFHGFAVENIRPKVDVTAFDGIAADARTTRKTDSWLSNEIARIGDHLKPKFLDLCGATMRADQHAVAACLVDALDDKLGEV